MAHFPKEVQVHREHKVDGVAANLSSTFPALNWVSNNLVLAFFVLLDSISEAHLLCQMGTSPNLRSLFLSRNLLCILLSPLCVALPAMPQS